MIVNPNLAGNQDLVRRSGFRLRTRRRILPILAALFLFVASGLHLTADPSSLSEYQVKAGFLFNFTRFVEWPEKAFATPTSPIVLCIVGDTPLSDPLAGAVDGKVVNGRVLSIRN